MQAPVLQKNAHSNRLVFLPQIQTHLSESSQFMKKNPDSDRWIKKDDFNQINRQFQEQTRKIEGLLRGFGFEEQNTINSTKRSDHGSCKIFAYLFLYTMYIRL